MSTSGRNLLDEVEAAGVDASTSIAEAIAAADAATAAAAGKLDTATAAATYAPLTETAALETDKLDVISLSTAQVGALRFKDDPEALLIADVIGTNGRRLSIQPVDAGTSTASAQLEIVPGSNVDPAEITSQILLYNKTGANHERFVISCYNGEYQFHASRLGTGVARPFYFYTDSIKSYGVMQDATFRHYTKVTFGATGDANLEWVAAGVLSTNSQLRVNASGTGHEVRIGNVSGLNRPTVSFNSAGGICNLSGNGTQLELAGSLKVSGGFGVNGAAAAVKQTLAAAATDAATTQALVNQLRAALITFGLAQ